jgi:hypothetical protein
MTRAPILLALVFAAVTVRGQAPSQEVRGDVAKNATGSAPIRAAAAADLSAEALAEADVRVQTALSQTALWAGQVVTYTVTLTCRPTVDILQGDLDADKLALEGLQVVGQSLQREATSDGGTKYVVTYRLTTFEPGAEKVGVGDWTVRYAIGAAAGASAPAQEVRVPGAALAWRSALPDEPKTLDLRGDRGVEPVPVWWQHTRSIALGLIVASIVAVGGLVATRVASTRPRDQRRKARRDAARDLRTTLTELADADMSTPAARVSAYERLEAAVRRHAGEVTGLPAAALTPAEFRQRANGTPLSGDDVGRVLESCQRARFAPLERVPDAADFRATLEDARRFVGG